MTVDPIRVAAPAPSSLRTQRLLLRRWRPDDREPFAQLNADPEVRRFFPSTLTRAESDASVAVYEPWFEELGYGLWAIEPLPGQPGAGRFAGFVGLAPATFDAEFAPAVEVGWRLARWSWGRGYATEAAEASLVDGFERAGLDEIVSFTAVSNEPSRRVMTKIGLHHDPADDFDHPVLAVDDPLRRHVLYRCSAAAWRNRSESGPAEG